MTQSLPASGLYFRVPAKVDEHTLQAVRQFAFVVNRSNYERNMHVIEIDAANAAADQIALLVTIIQSQGIVAIIRGSAEIAKAVEADGVILTDATQYAPARTLLGQESIIGLSCNQGQSEAEALVKLRPDYIFFGDEPSPGLFVPSLLRWLSQYEDISSVSGGTVTNDNAAHLVQAGATFLDCSDYIWSHEKGVMQAISNMLYAIDLASAKPDTLN